MKLTLQEKIKRDMALTLGEIAEATGYSRVALWRAGFRRHHLFAGKMRLSDFWRWVQRNNSDVPEPTIIGRAVLSPSRGRRSIADKSREPRESSALQDALRLRGAGQPRSTELQTSPS